MTQMRIIGSNIEYLFKKSQLPINVLCNVLLMDDREINRLFKGRVFLTYKGLKCVSDMFNVSIDDIMNKDMTGTHQDPSKEFIMDIIDDFIDIYEATKLAE